MATLALPVVVCLMVTLLGIQGEGTEYTEQDMTMLETLLGLTGSEKVQSLTKDGLMEHKRWFWSQKPRTFECRGNRYILTARGFDKGILQSFNYGRGNYGNNAECQWIITAPAGKVLQLTFRERFSVAGSSDDCYADRVEVYDGRMSDGYLIGQYCGTIKPTTVTTSGDVMTVRFYADSYQGSVGFKAMFKAVDMDTSFPTEPELEPSTQPPTQPPVEPSNPIGSGGQGAAAKGCGRTRYVKRILNGQESAVGQWPWIIHMRVYTSSTSYMQCGGTLIDPSWVLTAAHCLEDQGAKQRITDPNKIELHFGEHDVDDWDAAQFMKRPSKVIIHPSRSSMGVAPYDIALLKLARPLSLNDDVNIACLPQSASDFPAGTPCVVSGWGKTHKDQGTSDKLLHVGLDMVTAEQCRRYFGDAVGNDVVCAQRTQSIASSCQGDSGGPLVCQKDGAYTLLGVVSYGSPCGMYAQSLPAAFASVTYFRSWIDSTMAAYS